MTERPTSEPGTGSNRLAGRLGDRLADLFAAVRPAGVRRGRVGAVTDSRCAARVEKMSLQAGMSFRISGLYEYIAAFFLKPESAYFSIGFGNVHPAPELGVE